MNSFSQFAFSSPFLLTGLALAPWMLVVVPTSLLLVVFGALPLVRNWKAALIVVSLLVLNIISFEHLESSSDYVYNFWLLLGIPAQLSVWAFYCSTHYGENSARLSKIFRVASYLLVAVVVWSGLVLGYIAIID